MAINHRLRQLLMQAKPLILRKIDSGLTDHEVAEHTIEEYPDIADHLTTAQLAQAVRRERKRLQALNNLDQIHTILVRKLWDVLRNTASDNIKLKAVAQLVDIYGGKDFVEEIFKRKLSRPETTQHEQQLLTDLRDQLRSTA